MEFWLSNQMALGWETRFMVAVMPVAEMVRLLREAGYGDANAWNHKNISKVWY
jgi:hypothetical protein